MTRSELAGLRASRDALAVCLDVHEQDIAAIRTLTSTASSPALDVCAVLGTVLGGAGASCAGLSEDARTACVVGGAISAAVGATCAIVRIW